MIAKKYVNRILKLADFMEKLPPKRFNFNHWVGENWKGAQDLSCGTTACALGWATTMPIFRKLGLRMIKDVDIFGEPNGFPSIGAYSYPESVGKEIFGIDPDYFNQLFKPFESGLGDKATPKQWARHARQIAAELAKKDTP